MPIPGLRRHAPRRSRRPLARSRCALVAFAALALTAIGALPAHADFPGRNGRVTFMRLDASDHWQVWVGSDPALADQMKLTDADADSGWPVWAPGGQRIAFDSSRTDPDPNDATVINDVFTVDPQTGAVQQLTDSEGFSGDAAYAPDGASLAFDADRGDYPAAQGIYIMSLATRQLRRVTTIPGAGWMDLAPRFSPDGRRLVFTRYKNVNHTNAHGVLDGELSALFVVNADGGNLRQITAFGLHPGDADWSPDGRRIVFETAGFEHPGRGADVYTVSPDGSGLTDVTRNAGVRGIGNANAFVFENSSDPVWSPDGTTILFLDGVFDGSDILEGMATMQPDGTNRAFTPINGPDGEHQPDWETLPATP
jgi:Tol biopolymer transport system component